MSHQMAPWVPMFIQSCKNNTEPFVSFQFATVDKSTNKPRCRTVVFRDFLFHDKKTNILTFNTDMRSSKITESFVGTKPNGSRGNQACETPFFEACVYFPETWEQYRFSGQIFTISKQCKEIPVKLITKYDIYSPRFSEMSDNSTDEDIDTSINDDDDKTNDNINDDKKLIETIADDRHHEDEDDYYPQSQEWEAELLRQWSSLSRHTKSLYRKPAPGQKLTSETRKKLDKLHRGVDGAKEDAGLENFGIVCLCIDSVDFLNLKEGRGGERWIFQKTDGHDEEDLWEEQEVCP
ncbi:YGR017W [Saccharomyces arboricola H-6]|uniref:YGR017W n=1 Tax=Saccharomyces arboricola (strain H-6 / AS 2.3317 / CBS 10644) TaxID=1160507 RepID=J8Q503_SACAR|nr:YGR017W [Saccharomyces arboricola H-6]